MGTAVRGTKASGGTDYTDDTPALASEVNADFNTIYSAFNGDIEDSNVKAAANIDPSKIGDYSADASEQQTATSPGDSETPTLATDLETELEQLRYRLEELSGGVDLTRVNSGGTTTGSWTDLPFRHQNLIYNSTGNGQGDVGTNGLDGWEVEGTLSDLSQDAGNGRGDGITFTTSAVDSGIKQVLANLKANSKYVLLVEARRDSGTITVTTSGADATSGYRDLSMTIASGSFTVVSGIFEAGSLQHTIQIVNDTNGSNTDVRRVLLFECSASAEMEPAGPFFNSDRLTSTQNLTTSWASITGLSIGSFSHRPSKIVIRCAIAILFSGAGRAYGRLQLTDPLSGNTTTDPFGVTGDTGDVQTINIYHEILLNDSSSGNSLTVEPQVIASGAVGTVNGTADTLTLASTLFVEEVLPG